MTGPTAGVTPPPLDPGDVYLYSHGNGAIFVLEARGRSRLVTLDDAVAVVAGCHTAGGRVVVGWDDTAIARAVIERIRSAGVPVVEAAGAQPPHTWGEGTDAVMEAAAVAADRLLDDLLARGVDVQHRDDSGSTALHHAAAHGNLHAIEALVSAGADLDLANHDGFTPHALALATRQQAAAQRLVALGAARVGGPGAGAVLPAQPPRHALLVGADPARPDRHRDRDPVAPLGHRCPRRSRGARRLRRAVAAPRLLGRRRTPSPERHHAHAARHAG